jgi:hypothetical protein
VHPTTSPSATFHSVKGTFDVSTMTSNPRQNYAPAHGGYKSHNMHNAYGGGQGHGANQYLPRGLPVSPPGEASMQSLTNTMAAINMHGSYGSTSTSKSAASGMSGNSSDYSNVQQLQGQSLWVPNQHVHLNGMYQMMPGAQQQAGMTPSPNMYNHAGGYMPQASYQYGQAMDHSPMQPAWAGRLASAEMPSLMTPRRDSISSNENDIPGTPYGSGGMYRYGAGATIMDRSPSAVYTNSATPSPSSMAHPYQLMAPMVKQQQIVPNLAPELLALVHQDPPIPRAIPAPSSPHKPLDRSLENKTGETNVYIRGLLPETTDEMLQTWGRRFGDIQSSKSIIDMKTQLCKG